MEEEDTIIYSSTPIINHLTIEDNGGNQFVVGTDWNGAVNGSSTGSYTTTYTMPVYAYQDAQIDEAYVRKLAREEAKKMIQEMLDSGEIIRRTDIVQADQRRIMV